MHTGMSFRYNVANTSYNMAVFVSSVQPSFLCSTNEFLLPQPPSSPHSLLCIRVNTFCSV